MKKAKCMICGQEFPISIMKKVFTGRIQYMCQKCEELGDKEVSAKIKEWRDSLKGQRIIERCNKKR